MAERKTHTIDATGKILGRLASEISILLRGKHKKEFQPIRIWAILSLSKMLIELELPGKKWKRKNIIATQNIWVV